MPRTESRPRMRTWLVLPVALAGFALAACAPPPEPPEPVTPWFEPGCVTSDQAGVPDFEFTGYANQLDNATAFFDETGAYVEDGTCDGTPGDTGVIVRAVDEADAIDVCAAVGAPVADPARLVDYGYSAPIDAWTCVNETTDPGVVEFSGPGLVAVTIFGGTPEEPTETTVNFTGTGSGTWDQGGTGAFAMNLTVDDGTFDASTPIGDVTIGYSATQIGTATGSFDPTTGEGGFQMAVDMDLVTLNGSPMPQPCTIGTSFDFTGSIDLTTGEATVSQENFTMTPPGDADCGGLGAIIGPMLAEGENAATMTFQVLEP